MMRTLQLLLGIIWAKLNRKQRGLIKSSTLSVALSYGLFYLAILPTDPKINVSYESAIGSMSSFPNTMVTVETNTEIINYPDPMEVSGPRMVPPSAPVKTVPTAAPIPAPAAPTKPKHMVTQIANYHKVGTRGNLADYGAANDQLAKLAYIARFTEIAIGERDNYNIPAAITLAQGILESDAGRSKLAKSNNHFGIKRFGKIWPANLDALIVGTTSVHDDCCTSKRCKTPDGFVAFDRPWASFRAHSVLLTKSRYNKLRRLPVTDYKGWAHGLRKAGYATDKRYAEKVIRIIEDFNLHVLDQ